MFTKLFNWLKPASRRARIVQPTANDQIMARLTDHDPVYRALMDLAYDMVENYSLAMTSPDITSPMQRDYLAGRAAAMMGFVQEVESWRERARNAAQQQPHDNYPHLRAAL